MTSTDTKAALSPTSALADLRVLELGHFVAAPFCTRLLGDLGADVIKVEPLKGDPVREWGAQVGGRSLWWSVHGRNKRSVSIDVRAPGACELVLGLAAKSDVIVENFRPGHMGKLGLGDAALRAQNPDLVIAHVSGFGQDGPYGKKPAFGVIGEAIGGLRYLSDHAPGTCDLPPVRAGISVGDSVAGLYAAFGIMVALWQRSRAGGTTVDVALSEAVLSLMEGMLPEYSRLGIVRQPTGSRIATAAPSSAYPTADGARVIIAANSDILFAKLCDRMGRPELAADPRFHGNRARVENVEALDAEIDRWSLTFDAATLLKALEEANIPSCKIYTAVDCANDIQFRHRNMVREANDTNFGTILHPGIVPHIVESPGSVRWTGPDVGAHTDAVLTELLGMKAERLAELRERRVIA
ncbi:MAG: CoA transferase [Rhizobiaceae bacterium]|nr:MAG: CoA transferase [Rhizobiaceae bacterium]